MLGAGRTLAAALLPRFDHDRRAGAAAPGGGEHRPGGGRPEKWDRRLVLDAIFSLVRGQIAWRALPAALRVLVPQQAAGGATDIRLFGLATVRRLWATARRGPAG